MISIVVPVYNSSQYLSRCIECVLNQTFKDWELLLVDDGIFLFPKLKNTKKQYLDTILGIKEIDELKTNAHVFSCARWIKWAILYRCSSLFYVYIKLCR